MHPWTPPDTLRFFPLCFPRRAVPGPHLSAAAVAAALMAKWRMALSSTYFCSHLVMSASSARMRSSFSLTSSMSAGALYSGRLAGWPLPCFWRSGRNNTSMLNRAAKQTACGQSSPGKRSRFTQVLQRVSHASARPCLLSSTGDPNGWIPTLSTPISGSSSSFNSPGTLPKAQRDPNFADGKTKQLRKLECTVLCL